MKNLGWIGSSQRDLKSFPHDVMRRFGQALHFAQAGEMHPHAKPLKGFRSGVFEIVEDFRSDTFRVVYAVRIAGKIYVLHAFQKKAKKGIKTPQKEINVIKSRLKMAKEVANG